MVCDKNLLGFKVLKKERERVINKSIIVKLIIVV